MLQPSQPGAPLAPWRSNATQPITAVAGAAIAKVQAVAVPAVEGTRNVSHGTAAVAALLWAGMSAGA